jgi:hypothetical protein
MTCSFPYTFRRAAGPPVRRSAGEVAGRGVVPPFRPSPRPPPAAPAPAPPAG